MSRWAWILTVLSTRLWIRASVYGILAVVTALISIYVRHYIPDDISQKIGADAVDGILNILASSMLAVTIFSVSTMVSAYSAATNNVTPRATRLLVEDKVSHNALSTFIGGFIFSIVGIIALKKGVYGNSGRLVLLVVTIIVLFAIVVTLLRWIEYLSKLGRVSETVERVEKAVTSAFRARLANPYLGGTPWLRAADLPSGVTALWADRVGYVQHVDMERLAEVASAKGGSIYIEAVPGKLVYPRKPLAWMHRINDEEDMSQALEAFVIDRERSFRQDPRYGMAVLSEIAARALSPSVNDPGTAIHVISVGLRVLLLWTGRAPLGTEKVLYPAIHVPGLEVSEMLDDFFSPIERDGASMLEVGRSLQKAFTALALSDHADLKRAAHDHSQTALEYGRKALALESEITALEAAAKH
jgi:uncharacterized membrane protein